eukprot:3934256-Rhodomonas_salina.1
MSETAATSHATPRSAHITPKLATSLPPCTVTFRFERFATAEQMRRFPLLSSPQARPLLHGSSAPSLPACHATA